MSASRVVRGTLPGPPPVAANLIPGDDEYPSVRKVVRMEHAASLADDLPVIPPMLATSGEPPTGAGWAVEFKWDGVVRVQAFPQ